MEQTVKVIFCLCIISNCLMCENKPTDAHTADAFEGLFYNVLPFISSGENATSEELV